MDTLKFLLLCWTLHQFAVGFGEDEDYDEFPERLLPSFVPKPSNFTFKEGQLARLECAVENLGTKNVVWRRASDPNPMTIGRRRFVSDKRISVEHEPMSQSWNLLIRRVRPEDSGRYECQISSTRRDLRHFIHLHVIEQKGVYIPAGDETEEAEKEDDWARPGEVDEEMEEKRKSAEREIQISGSNYIERGGTIKLTCNATGEEYTPEELDWFKDGDKLTTDFSREIFIQKRVSLTTKTIISILEIKNAMLSDAGVYICRTSTLHVTSTRVNVLNADTHNVKRGKDFSEIGTVKKDLTRGQSWTDKNVALPAGSASPLCACAMVTWTVCALSWILTGLVT